MARACKSTRGEHKFSGRDNTAGSDRRIPAPAHPHERREPLPWHAPTSAEDGPEDRDLFWYAETAE